MRAMGGGVTATLSRLPSSDLNESYPKYLLEKSISPLYTTFGSEFLFHLITAITTTMQ